MIRISAFLLAFALLLSACWRTKVPHPPASGAIASDPGGTAGYQHGLDRSKFTVGANRHEVSEFGFVKVVGSEGTFAVDANNGLAVAITNANSPRAKSTRWYTGDSTQHNQIVKDYFVGAGIPKEQVGGVHATMSLSTSANGEQLPRPQPGVGGYQSILDRKIGEVPVVDSVAWARMNDAGEVLTEWVYWPAISAKVTADAGRMRELLSKDADKKAYLVKLPPNLPAGTVVIRHSSATSAQPFEAFASYDVLERRTSPDASTEQGPGSRAVLIVRHFDINGEERKLPQERAQLAGDYPSTKRQPEAKRPQK
ncbi:MAG TPA: hypothetical protein VKB46_23455 [Pyrinomonadaceae bacterium]|nr:hypothetical protein [Pyrinomonadaceae bacterium]